MLIHVRMIFSNMFIRIGMADIFCQSGPNEEEIKIDNKEGGGWRES